MAANKSPVKMLNWQDSAASFDARAGEYDSWFDNNPLFQIELEALLAIREKLTHPFLEIGVGPGRFGEALNIDFGIDPALSPLQRACARNILGIKAIGEQLPIRTASTGTVFILFSLCFLADPVQALRECSRILVPEGRLVLGLIPRLSPWGELLAQKKKENNPFYRHAQLRTIAESIKLLTETEFSMTESWSTLVQAPGNSLVTETPRQGINEHAGFCVLVMSKKEDADEFTQSHHPDD